jgi:hypothetical protein
MIGGWIRLPERQDVEDVQIRVEEPAFGDRSSVSGATGLFRFQHSSDRSMRGEKEDC